MKPSNKVCTKCGVNKNFSEYGYSSKGRYGLLSWCKTCGNIRQQEWRLTNKEKVNSRAREYYHNRAKENPELFYHAKRSKAIKASYGLTIDEYNEKLNIQGHSCPICREEFDLNKGKYAFSLDHNHTTGKIRDFLCSRCNLALGGFNDNIDILKSAINYLKRHNNEA